MSVTSWFLKSSAGTRHRLPREMIFVGRDDCELMVQSRSVDKQHAVINYDPNTDEHMVKDLGSLNGTFVNDLRIPDQTYITLKLSDVIRFGYDAHVYILEKSQHKVPEEALKHEKYTSQLQMSIKALEAKVKEKQLHSPEKIKDFVSKVKHQERAERKAHSFTAATESPISKPTPLYGQPSWWGDDDDPGNKKSTRGGKQPEVGTPDSAKDPSRYEVNGSLSDSQAKCIFSYRREPSYFEIPTKELHQRPAKKPESQVHEIPTKDIPDLSESVLSTPTPPVVQSHASFTIEFDDCTPGKMKIKDHITKFSCRQQKKLLHTETASTPTEVMSAESKVADWLVQSNASMVRRRSQAEDLYSTTSDPSMQKARHSNWEDGTHSDSGVPGTNGSDFLTSDVQSTSHISHHQSHSPPERYASPESEEPTSPDPHTFHSATKAETKQSFVIEIFDDNQRKKRSQSFTNNTTPPQVPGFRPESKRSPSPTEERTPPTQRYTVPLKGCDSPGPQRAGSLRREKTEDRISTSFSSRSTSSVSSRPFSSVGRKSKLARDFTAEFMKQSKQSVSAERKTHSPPTAKELPSQNKHSTPPQITTNQPQTSSPIHHPVPLNSTVTSVPHDSSEVKTPHCSRHEEEDSLSDAGTYTIEADVQDKELEEARSNIDQIQPPKWMSRWASLADSYVECDPSSNMLDTFSQPELSGAGHGPNRHTATSSQSQESTDTSVSQTSTYQASTGNKSDIQTPSIHVHYDMQTTFDMDKSGLVPLRSQNSPLRLSVQDDVEPDSLSDASNSGEGSIVEQRRKTLLDSEEKKSNPPTLQPKSTSFYIGSDENAVQPESSVKAEKKHSGKPFSTATLTKPRAGQESVKVRPSISAPILGHGADAEPTDSVGATLVRQESFTKDRPSNARLPNISSPESLQGSGSQDTHSYLKQTEDVLAALEAKLQATHTAPSPSPVMDSAESDVDTSSTVSQHSNKTKPNQVSKKPSNHFHRERSSASITSQDSNAQNSVSDKQRNLKTDTFRKPAGMRRSVGKHGSTDFSDDHQSSSRLYSDQESSHPQVSRKYTRPLEKEDSKPTKVSQALSRANSLSAPRPTRASMLRRARLGESDNEGAETEKLSQDTVKQPQEPKKLSRWDMLAMPRKRTSSFNTPSDNEASSGPQWTGRSAGSNRNADTGPNSGRKSSISGNKPGERPQKAPLNKAPITRVRPSSAKYTSSTASSRRRQKGSDYTSTSDEEYDSNQSTPKPKRSQPSSASHSPRSQPRPQPVVALRPMSRNKDSEDENHEGEAFHNWSTHSAEIARLSEDLAKDLAILAREIHDVAGDADVPNPGAASSLTAHEQLNQRIPETENNYQRGRSASAGATETVHKLGHQQSAGHQDQSKEKVQMDSQLDPVSQIIGSIRENTEELSEKIKVLFQDKLEIWEEIEARIHADDNAPVFKTSNKEIASILLELRRVQRQLEVMNTVIKPSDQLEVRQTSVSASGVRPSRVVTSQEWRTAPPVSRQGGGPRPGDRVRRAATASGDGREGYLV